MDWSQTVGWFLLVGVIGAAVNWLVMGNYRFLPSRVSPAKESPIAQIGLLSHMLLGAMAGLASLGMFVLAGLDESGGTLGARQALLAGVLPLAFLLPRWVSAEVEKRLLRAAVFKACQVPAAHPDSTRGIERATAQAVYAICDRLVPDRAVWSADVRQRQEELVCR